MGEFNTGRREHIQFHDPLAPIALAALKAYSISSSDHLAGETLWIFSVEILPGNKE